MVERRPEQYLPSPQEERDGDPLFENPREGPRLPDGGEPNSEIGFQEVLEIIESCDTTKDIAERLGVSESLVARYFRQGRIKGAKLGGKWFAFEEDVEEFEGQPRKHGRPPKRKNCAIED